QASHCSCSPFAAPSRSEYSLKQIFDDELGAVEAQDQEQEADESAANGGCPSPSQAMTAPQQNRKHDPGEDGEEGLVQQSSLPHVFDKDEAGDETEAEQNLPDPEQLEQKILHVLQRREAFDHSGCMTVAQLVVLEGQ